MEPKDQIEAENEGQAYLSSATATLESDYVSLTAKAEEYKSQGDEEFRKLEHNSAVDFYTQGIQVKCKDEALNAELYGKRATAHYLVGDYNEALGDARAARIFQPSNVQAIIIGAKACVKLSQFEEAISWCEDGLAESHYKNPMGFHPLNLDIADKVGVRKHEALHYLKLGDSFSEMSHFNEALDSYAEYLRICKEQSNRAGEGHAYGRLGNVYNNVSKVEAALHFFKMQLSISKEVGDRKEEGRALNNLGRVYILRPKDLRRAWEMFQCHLSVSIELGDRSGERDAYDNFGRVRDRLGDKKGAIEYFRKSLTIARELGDRVGEGKVYRYLGRTYRRIGNFEQAVEYNERELGIAKEEGGKGNEACAYYEMGRNLESLRTEEKAVECYKSSVKLFNEIRACLRSRENNIFNDQWRIELFDELKHAYSSLIRLLLKLNFHSEAVWAAEQSRAQALADVMVYRYGSKAVQRLSVAQEEWVSEIYRYISTNTVFFEIDTDAIYIWLLMPGQPVHFRSFSVDCKATRHRDATDYLQSLRERFTEPKIQVPRVLPKDGFDPHPLKTLHDALFGPIVNQIQGDELVIIPCGPLFMFPFAAFVDPDSKYLCESFRIRVAPSLTSLKMIADCPKGYHRESGALIVGDPCMAELTAELGRPKFEQLPYVRQEAKMIASLINTDALVGKKATKMAVLEKLNSVALVHIAARSQKESGEIILAPNPTWKYKDPEKKDYLLTKEEVSYARVRAQLDGLSCFHSAGGTPNPTRKYKIPEEKYYLLTMEEVFSARVRAQLVVLSCCYSGEGEIKAEGVVGIARAFLAAGARSVLVSLWGIRDEATIEFMKSFYQHLVEGNKASEALKKAMKCLRESDEFNDVRHWAPFVLIGDDVTLKLPFADNQDRDAE